jgi:hypothetical protein
MRVNFESIRWGWEHAFILAWSLDFIELTRAFYCSATFVRETKTCTKHLGRSIGCDETHRSDWRAFVTFLSRGRLEFSADDFLSEWKSEKHLEIFPSMNASELLLMKIVPVDHSLNSPLAGVPRYWHWRLSFAVGKWRICLLSISEHCCKRETCWRAG